MSNKVTIQHNNPSSALSVVQFRSGDVVEFDFDCKAEIDTEMAERIKQSGEDIKQLGKSKDSKKDDLKSQSTESQPLQSNTSSGSSEQTNDESGDDEGGSDDSESESSYTKSQLNEMKVADLQEIAKESKLPEDDWKSLKKPELVDYILSQV